MTFSDKGGAGIAAGIHKDAISDAGHEAVMFTAKHKFKDGQVVNKNFFEKLIVEIKARMFKIFDLFEKNVPEIQTSYNFFETNLSTCINKLDFDIINIHWIGGEFISLNDLARIKKPIIWFHHDMWGVSGSKHYTNRENIKIYKKKRSIGFNLDKYLYSKKRKLLLKMRNLFHVSPSMWLKDELIKFGFKENKVSVINNAVDFNEFKFLDKVKSREVLSLPLQKHIVAMGSLLQNNSLHKGAKFNSIIKKFCADNDIFLIIFGSKGKKTSEENFMNYGVISERHEMNLLLSSADFTLIPSLIDNFPNTAIESFASGTPICGFKDTGVSEQINDGMLGFVAENGKISDLLNQLKDNLNNEANKEQYEKNLILVAKDKYGTTRLKNDWAKFMENLAIE